MGHGWLERLFGSNYCRGNLGDYHCWISGFKYFRSQRLIPWGDIDSDKGNEDFSTDDVRFNTCLTSDDRPYSAYSTVVHEAGHVLGISGGHPSVYDAVMNYDWLVGGPLFEEPDCSPYPLDIMAIYALYQTVN